MYLHHRSMQHKDVPECVEIVAAHPTIGQQYKSAAGDLRRAWSSLLGREAMKARSRAPVRESVLSASVCASTTTS